MKKAEEEIKGVTNNTLNKSTGILSDIRLFFFKKPKIETFIKYKSEKQREFFSQRIMQRIGMDVANYSVLNIHQIGISAPVNHVFEELQKWDGDSMYWPNSVARVVRNNNRLDDIQILLFGLSKYPFGFKNGLLGLEYIPLFNLNKIKFQNVPDPSNSDNARYLLFKCSGGYPIGIFAMYVRSAINENNEVEQSQLFFLVGFNFYGKENISNKNVINILWEAIHNRFTSNIMNRFKILCEDNFKNIKDGV